MLALLDFPCEILIHILSYCDESSLRNLYKTCKLFQRLTSYHEHWSTLSKQCFASNQSMQYILNKSFLVISPFDKCRISNNWIRGIYKQTTFLSMSQSYMPCLQLDRNHLWIGCGKTIKGYKRTIVEKYVDEVSKIPRPDYVIGDASSRTDVSRFRCHENLVVYNQDNKLCCYDTINRTYIFKRSMGTPSESGSWKTNDALDLNGEKNIVAFLTNRSVYVSQLDDLKSKQIDSFSPWEKECWRLRLCDGRSEMLVGAMKDGFCYLFDVEKCVELSKFGGPNGCNTVIDICWQTPTTFLTGGYDAAIRLWDTRCSTISRAEMELEDPFNSAIYCITSDKNYSVLAGMQMNARVNACDLRTSKFVQVYYVKTKYPSPIYGLDFEPRQMYAATANGIFVLDFTTCKRPVAVHSLKGVHIGYKNDHRTWLR